RRCEGTRRDRRPAARRPADGGARQGPPVRGLPLRQQGRAAHVDLLRALDLATQAHEHRMNTPPKGFAAWGPRQWTLMIMALLILTLTPLGLIQWRQWQKLQDTELRQVDSIMWQAYQLERELSRFDTVLDEAIHRSADVLSDDLVERHEIFLSR